MDTPYPGNMSSSAKTGSTVPAVLKRLVPPSGLEGDSERNGCDYYYYFFSLQ